jgi:hypothetical protein
LVSVFGPAVSGLGLKIQGSGFIDQGSTFKIDDLE